MLKPILSNRQQLVLSLLFANNNIKDNFYFTGGTALAQFYLHHRYSEDLDFFTENEFDPSSIQVVFKSISEVIKLKKIDFQQSFNRNLFFLHFTDEVIKTEFTYFPFTPIIKAKKINGVLVDSLIDIAVNKTFTIYQKPRSRDFIDLYLIIKKDGLSFTDLRQKAHQKFDTNIDPLQMAQQLLEVENLKDYLRMIIPLDDIIWQTFWKKEAYKLKDEVIEV